MVTPILPQAGQGRGAGEREHSGREEAVEDLCRLRDRDFIRGLIYTGAMRRDRWTCFLVCRAVSCEQKSDGLLSMHVILSKTYDDLGAVHTTCTGGGWVGGEHDCKLCGVRRIPDML